MFGNKTLNKNRLYIFFLYGLLILSSCYKDYDIFNQTEIEPQIVINGFVERDSSFYLSIGRSNLPSKINVSDKDIDVDSLKIYKVIGNQRVLVEQKNNFHSPFISMYKIGNKEKYYIEVYAIGKKASVVSTVPDSVHMDNVEFNNLTIDTFSNGEIYTANINTDISITFKDPDTNNYYIFSGLYLAPNFYYDTTTYTYTDSLLGLMPIPIDYDYSSLNQVHRLIPMYMPPRFSGMAFADEIFNGQTYTITLNASLTVNYNQQLLQFYPYLPVLIELITIDKAMFKHAESKIKYYRALYNPFAEPANVYCNINNGFGIVGALNRTHIVKLLNINELINQKR